MHDLSHVRHLVHEARWSTARALASGDAVALAYVRNHAAKASVVVSSDRMACGEGVSTSYGDGRGGGFSWGYPPEDVYAFSEGAGVGNGAAYYGDRNSGDGLGRGDGNWRDTGDGFNYGFYDGNGAGYGHG